MNYPRLNLTELLSRPVEAHRVRVEAATPRILRVSVAARRELEDRPSHALVEQKFAPVQFDTRRKGKATRIQCDGMTVEVIDTPFSIRVIDSAGAVRFETAPASESGKYTDADAGNSPFQFGDAGIIFSRRMADGELAYGFGEMGETLNRAGHRFTLWNTDDVRHTPRQNFYCQIPFGIHMVPRTAKPPLVLGLFVDNPGRVEIDLERTAPGVAQYTVSTGDFVLWMILADDIADCLEKWTALTGRMERPPLWALGYHQCRYSYYPEKQVLKIAREFRRRKIPCDAIYLDIHYMDEFRPFTWDKKRFPNPARLLATLSEQGFRTVTIMDPGIKVDEKDSVYRDFLSEEGYFCGAPDEESEEQALQRQRVEHGDAPLLTEEVLEHRTPAEHPQVISDKYFAGTVWPGAVNFPDFLRADVRRLWGRHQKRVLLDIGIAGIWNDMNEPAVFDTPHRTFPDHVVHQEFGEPRHHKELHQVYGMYMARASYEGIRATQPNVRPFVITRAGWAGVQRYAMLWTGDNTSTWASMLLDVQLNLGMGLTGIAMVGCDIGGFGHDAYPELFARWIEWGVFQPFCRTHSAIDTLDQEPWSYGPEVDKLCREMIGLRMRLLPYFATLLAEAAATGAPVNRPLLWHYADDANTHNLGDQFLLGQNLLIAPILTAATTERLVYFPRGEWIHLFTGERVEGATRAVVCAPIGTPAVYLRCGAILPMHDPIRQHTNEPEPETTVLLVALAAEMSGRLVEDDGCTRAYLKGQQAVYEFRGEMKNNKVVLTISAPKGKYRGVRKWWVIRCCTAARPAAKAAAPTAEFVEVRVPVSEKRIQVEIDLAGR